MLFGIGSLYWNLVLAVCTGIWYWQSVLEFGIGSLYWNLVLAVNTGIWYWQSVLEFTFLADRYTNIAAFKVVGLRSIILQKILIIHKTILVNNQLDAQFFFLVRLFQSSACFEQPRAHHQEHQLYLYNAWYMSICVSGCLV
jgi:hypothetical protein